MKSLHTAFRFGVLLSIVLAACAPGSTPAAPGSEQPGTPGTPGPAPVDISGPIMALGSTWLYADGSLLVAVPAGTFTMGGGKTDNPAHQVNLSDFWIYRTKVTNFQYAYCVAVGQCTLPSKKENPGFIDPLRGNEPVVGVDHEQASAYCTFVHARLPTEAEWEKAARGPDANIYPWGAAAPNCDLLNYETCQGKTTPVNAYPQGQSYYHAFDTEGNTFEWVADWYKADYYGSAPADNPQGPEKGQARSVRSSAFNSGTNQTQTYNRFYSRPADQRANLGFRCVVEDPAYFAPFCQYPATYGTDGVGGGPTGEETQVDCPAMSIDQSPTCVEGQPITYVNFNGPPDAIIQVFGSNCSQPSNNQATCTGDGSLSICSSCDVTVTSQPQCPPGYQFQTGRYTGCVGPARPGQCLPGFHTGPPPTPVSFNGYSPIGYAPQPAGQCCIPDDGGLGTRADPACPAGTFFDGQECIATSVIFPFCKDASVSLNSCTPGGGPGGPTVCPPPPGGCGINYAWDTSSCTCVCNGC